MSWGSGGRAAGVLLALTLAIPAASPAAARAYAVSRGGTFTGHELVAPSLVLPQGTELVFVNLHVWGHNITSDAWRTPSDRLFRSDIASFGEHERVVGVETLEPGTYGFFCRNHLGMRGSITIV